MTKLTDLPNTLTTPATGDLMYIVDVSTTSPSSPGGLSCKITVDNIVANITNFPLTAFTAGSVPFINPSKLLAEDNANFYYDDTNNLLGLGTNNPGAVISGTTAYIPLVVGGHMQIITNSVSNNADKTGILSTAHYTVAQDPLIIVYGLSQTATSKVFLGGGSSLGNAATNIYFFGATNTTTTTGSQWGEWVDGDLGIGITPVRRLHVFDSAFTVGRLETNAAGIGPHLEFVFGSEIAIINSMPVTATDVHRRIAIEYRPFTAGRHNFYSGAGVAEANLLASFNQTGIIFPALTAKRFVTTATSNYLESTSLIDWIDATTNQTTVTDNGDGSVSVGTVQNINTSSSPTFSTLNTSGQVGILSSYLGSITSINDCPQWTLYNSRNTDAWPIGRTQKSHRIVFDDADVSTASLVFELYASPLSASGLQQEIVFNALGTAVMSIRNATAGVQIVAETLGVVTAPAYSVTGDLNTGWYSAGADQFNVATGGVLRLSISTTALTTVLPVFVPVGSTVALPQYSFFGDTDTGLTSILANVLTLVVGGSGKIGVTATGVNFATPIFMSTPDPIYLGGSATPSIAYGIGMDVFGGSDLVLFSPDKITFCYSTTSIGTMQFDTFSGVLTVSTQIILPSGNATSPALMLGTDWGTTDNGFYVAALDTMAMTVGGVGTFITSTKTDTDIFLTGSYLSTLFSRNGDTTEGLYIEVGGTTADNASSRIMFSENAYLYGMSVGFNGLASGELLGIPSNSGAIVLHNNNETGQNRMIFPRDDKYVGINIDAPLYPLHVKNPDSTTARICVENSTAVQGFFSVTDSQVVIEMNGLANAIAFNHSNAYVGLADAAVGTSAAALKRLHSSAAAATENSFWIENSGSGYSAFSITMHALWLTSNSMNVSSKYTPGIIFGSTDSAFTTEDPKLLAGIFGVATETYAGDTDAGMNVDILASAINGGASGTAIACLTISADEGCISNLNYAVGTLASHNNLIWPISCSWFIVDTSTTSQKMNWAVDVTGSNPMEKYRVLAKCEATKISFARDNTSGNVTYTITVTNITTATSVNCTIVSTGGAATGSSARATLSSELAFSDNDEMEVSIQVTTGSTDGSECTVIVFGYQTA